MADKYALVITTEGYIAVYEHPTKQAAEQAARDLLWADDFYDGDAGTTEESKLKFYGFDPRTAEWSYIVCWWADHFERDVFIQVTKLFDKPIDMHDDVWGGQAKMGFGIK